ncbi:MAG: hypothetical protein O7E52_17920 [Candidatus Poribacteria bacterium]|nr:hypothetical protein [Candidatus Poribacteria bacterium]
MYRVFGLLSVGICLLFASGCGLAAKQEWSENYALDEGTRATSPQMIDGNLRTFGETTFPEATQGFAGGTPASQAIIVLPEKRVIRRVVIHSENLKAFDVFADKGNGDWRVVKEVNTVKSSPIALSVNVAFPTDRIRIRVLSTTDDAELRRKERARTRGARWGMGNRRAPGKIYEIELYGYKSTAEAREQEAEAQREKELDDLLK